MYIFLFKYIVFYVINLNIQVFSKFMVIIFFKFLISGNFRPKFESNWF